MLDIVYFSGWIVGFSRSTADGYLAARIIWLILSTRLCASLVTSCYSVLNLIELDYKMLTSYFKLS